MKEEERTPVSLAPLNLHEGAEFKTDQDLQDCTDYTVKALKELADKWNRGAGVKLCIVGAILLVVGEAVKRGPTTTASLANAINNWLTQELNNVPT